MFGGREMNMRDEYVDGSYLSENPGWHEEDAPYKIGLIAQTIESNAIPHQSIVDVGCGAGLVSEMLARLFPVSQVTGFEISKDATVFWPKREQRQNLKFVNGSVFESGETFDLSVCLDVFEHVEDYYGFLRLLRPRARTHIFKIPLDMCVLKILTPALKAARDTVGHIQYFNDYTAVETLKDSGYQIQSAVLSPGFLWDARPKGAVQYVVYGLRRLCMLFGHKFAARMMGGYCLVVAARPTETA
jgi:SAM-dependent methyltransferase